MATINVIRTRIIKPNSGHFHKTTTLEQRHLAHQARPERSNNYVLSPPTTSTQQVQHRQNRNAGRVPLRPVDLLGSPQVVVREPELLLGARDDGFAPRVQRPVEAGGVGLHAIAARQRRAELSKEREDGLPGVLGRLAANHGTEPVVPDQKVHFLDRVRDGRVAAFEDLEERLTTASWCTTTAATKQAGVIAQHEGGGPVGKQYAGDTQLGHVHASLRLGQLAPHVGRAELSRVAKDARRPPLCRGAPGQVGGDAQDGRAPGAPDAVEEDALRVAAAAVFVEAQPAVHQRVVARGALVRAGGGDGVGDVGPAPAPLRQGFLARRGGEADAVRAEEGVEVLEAGGLGPAGEAGFVVVDGGARVDAGAAVDLEELL